MTHHDIYLDHAATTPIDPRVTAAMAPYWSDVFGNPSSLYRLGREAKKALEDARSVVSRILGAKAGEVLFTGGGTEAINLGLIGVARAHKNKGVHLVTTTIEHHAVLHTYDALEKEGFETSRVGVTPAGVVELLTIERAIRKDTILVAVMYANNEIGTIQPIAGIGELVKKIRRERKEHGNETPLFLFTDACQTPGALEINVEQLGVDLMVINGSKIYGPKGVGCLYVRKGVALSPIIHGGGQERGLRSGTENVPGIVGFASALEFASAERVSEYARETELRDYFIGCLLKRIPGCVLNGDPVRRLPNNVSISIPDMEGEALELFLDTEGIFVSTGSACSSASMESSHVLKAIGREQKLAFGTIRMTLGKSTTKEDLDRTVASLERIVAKLQK